MTISHIGVAVVLIGVAGSLAWQSEYLQVMHPGESAIGGRLSQSNSSAREDNVAGPNYTADARALSSSRRNGRFVAELQPERRIYTNPPQPLSTVAIHTNFISDLYVVLGDADGHGGLCRPHLSQSADPLAVLRRHHDGVGRHRVADRPPSPHRRAAAPARRPNSAARDAAGRGKPARGGAPSPSPRAAGSICCRCWPSRRSPVLHLAAASGRRRHHAEPDPLGDGSQAGAGSSICRRCWRANRASRPPI